MRGMPYTCPVCGFPGLTEPPMSRSGGGSYEICPSCGFQFGVDDEDRGETYAGWRARWVADGMPWRSASPAPAGWDPRAQLRGGERGQTAAELLGILFVVAAIIAAVFHSGFAPRLAGGLARQVDCIAQGGCPAQASTGGAQSPGGAGPGGAAAAGTLAGKVKDAADQAAEEPGNGWGNPSTLQDHFNRHGGDFNSSSPEEYAQQARDFFQRAAEEHLPTKVDTDGTIRVYDPATNEFGSYNPDGTTKTYFKPTRGPAYWDDQPGEDPYAPEEPGTGNGGKGGDEEPGGGGEEPGAGEPEVPEIPEVPEVPEVPEIPIPEIPIIP
jgi:hypothetical protein